MDYSYLIVNCLIENSEGKVLMVNLKKTDKWGLPGGKVELGENPRSALIREAKEEIGVDIKIEQLAGFREYFWESDNAFWIDLVYKASITKGTPKIKEPGKIIGLEWRSKEDIPQGTKFV